jgi:hypothetical protein
MKINGVHICNCNKRAVGHNDNCLRLAWRAARKYERNSQGSVKKEPVKKVDFIRDCFTCFYGEVLTCPGVQHGEYSCSGHDYKYWRPITNSKKES